MPSATRLGSEETMDQDVERFLRVLEADRGFSVNTIFAYRNDLTQFLTFLGGGRADESGRGPSVDGVGAERASSQVFPPVERWDQLTDNDLTNYLLFLRSRKYASST